MVSKPRVTGTNVGSDPDHRDVIVGKGPALENIDLVLILGIENMKDPEKESGKEIEEIEKGTTSANVLTVGNVTTNDQEKGTETVSGNEKENATENGKDITKIAIESVKGGSVLSTKEQFPEKGKMFGLLEKKYGNGIGKERETGMFEFGKNGNPRGIDLLAIKKHFSYKKVSPPFSVSLSHSIGTLYI